MYLETRETSLVQSGGLKENNIEQLTRPGPVVELHRTRVTKPNSAQQ